MIVVDALTDALRAEFAGDVAFAEAVPPSVTAPSVVVAPGDPFLAPATHGAIDERWDVLVAVSIKEMAPGVAQMRDLSRRVRKAAHSVGAIWEGATGPRRVGDAAQLVVSVNQIRFKYLDPSN